MITLYRCYKQCLDRFSYQAGFPTRQNLVCLHLRWMQDYQITSLGSLTQVLYMSMHFRYAGRILTAMHFHLSVSSIVLQKLQRDKAQGVFILQHWTTHPWYLKDLKMCATSFLPSTDERSIDITICSRSNLPSFKTAIDSLSPVREMYQQSGFSQLLWTHGKVPLRNSTGYI